MNRRNTFALMLAFLLLAQLPWPSATAQVQESWDVTKPRGKTRTIDFTTSEGTDMSVSASPDGKWLVFDLLAQIYRLSIAGGTAECLTQDSGIALNYHPSYSPDGRHIAFISDRKGQNNLWVMDADGKNPRSVYLNPNEKMVEPAWSADGKYIIVRRFGNGIWMYHPDGGEGVQLVSREQRGAAWPSPSSDGKYIYFQYDAGPPMGAQIPVGHRDAIGGAVQVRRLELLTGDIMDVTVGIDGQLAGRNSSGGAAAPEVSPDGRWLAFARRIPDGTVVFKGREVGPRNTLWLRDLKTGAERMVMDPIEMDSVEGVKTLRVLPGYKWMPDGKSIVLAQGGKIRKLTVESGRVETIPFSAPVHRIISEQAKNNFRISDEPFEARFLRWHTASPDCSKLVFQAVGKIWIQDMPAGTPRRLTPESFELFEYGPAWSPDGAWIAFTTLDIKTGGHLWKVAATGGTPVQLSREPGEYVHPAWKPDGSEIVAARGAGATVHGQSISENPWFELVRIPSGGGNATPVLRVDRAISGYGDSRQFVRPTYGPEGRICYIQRNPTGQPAVTQFVSVKADGTDKRVHLTFPDSDDVVPSPDGNWVAFQEGDNVYLAALLPGGTAGKPVHIDRARPSLPVKALSQNGGLYPHWRDAKTVEFGSSNRYYSYDVESGKTTEVEIHLRIPRDIPTGTIALRDARIVTMKGREVIEKGNIVIQNGRIRCVGQCPTDSADRVIDARGKTIIPGFIDMHAHHHNDDNGVIPARGYETAVSLAYGVTSDLDPYAYSQNVFPAAELVEAGKVIGPRTFSTGEGVDYNRGPRWNDINNYEAAERTVKRLKSWGAVSIKQYYLSRRDQRQWLIDAARKEGLTVTSEGWDLDYDLAVIMDGQTGWEHMLSYLPLYGDAAKFFGQAKAVYSVTLVGAGPTAWNEEYWWAKSDLWKDEKQRRWNPWRQLIPHSRRRVLRPDTDYSFPMTSQALADIIAEGGYAAFGGHGQQNALSTQWEIWMAATSLGAHGALEVASQHGAYFLGAQQDIGSLEVGKLGDLIVLNSNPLDDIRNTADMLYVMKQGVLYKADTLDEVWPRQRPFGDYYWTNPDVYRNDRRPIDYWDRNQSSKYSTTQRLPNESINH